jgi:hypothetical protein
MKTSYVEGRVLGLTVRNTGCCVRENARVDLLELEGVCVCFILGGRCLTRGNLLQSENLDEWSYKAGLAGGAFRFGLFQTLSLTSVPATQQDGSRRIRANESTPISVDNGTCLHSSVYGLVLLYTMRQAHCFTQERRDLRCECIPLGEKLVV